MGIDVDVDTAPNTKTLRKFRRLLEAHSLTEAVFDTINGYLTVKGSLLKTGTIVDSTIIAAPPSIKNKVAERDAEMHQTRKGNAL